MSAPASISNTECKVCGAAVAPYADGMFDDRYGYPNLYTVTRCVSCGLCETTPPLSDSDIIPLYSGFYQRQKIAVPSLQKTAPRIDWKFRFKNWLEGNHRIHYELDVVAPGSKKILEIGCGEGKSLVYLASVGYDAYGVETDQNVAQVRDTLGLQIHIGTIEDAPYPTQSFDYIIANQLIEHITDLDRFMARAKELLADSGELIFSTPNGASFYRALFGRRWVNWHIPYHQQIFTKKAFRILAEHHGLRITHMRTVSPTAWTIHQLHAIKNRPLPGIQNPYWTGKTTTGKLIRKLIFFGATLLGTPTNRILDMLGIGDCLIISFRKNTTNPV